MNNIFLDKNTGNFSAVNFIMIITIAVHAVVMLFPNTAGQFLIAYCGLSPRAVIYHGQVWRVISYALLHDPNMFFHILFNMLMLWMFGKEIEYMWGNRKFFVFYIFAALFSGIFSLLAIFFSSPFINIIGASGALMALLVVYAYYFPDRQLLFLFFIPMKIRTAVVVFAAISVFGTANNYGNVSHITHLGGIAAGFLWVQIGDKLDLIVRSISAFFQNISTKRGNDYNFQKERRQKTINAGEIDRILDKINRSGILSLTPNERKTLREASADYKKNKK